MTHPEPRPSLTRRDALRRLLVGAACLPFVDVLGGGWARADDAPARPGSAPGSAPGGPVTPSGGGTARAVIEIWMSGGPCHIDMWDPKPEAGQDYCGPLNTAQATNVDGMRLGALFPLLAKHGDKYSLIRSLSHGQNGHETATYISQTGRNGGDRLVYPSIGAVVSRFRGVDAGYAGRIPPYVILTAPLGRFSETGFLGQRYRPFVTGGDPNQRRFAVEGIVSESVTEERQVARRQLLADLDTLGRALPKSPQFEDFDRCGDRAYEMILGDAGKVFDLAQEKDDLRDLYGRNTFGQSCLAARRLVESGVPYVTVHSRGWDTHKQHFEIMRRRLPEIDRGVAALLEDLSQRGLLSSTVVWVCGEFGRTPRVQWEAPWNGGRGHHGKCFSALVAGGGFRGGVVVGATDRHGEDVAERPVHPRELHGAIYERLGIDPDGVLPNPRGLNVRVTDAAPEAAPFPGTVAPGTPVAPTAAPRKRLPEIT